MKQTKEDQLIAEAYTKIVEIALKPSESLNDIKKRFLFHMVLKTKRGKKRYTTPTGETFSLDRIILMVNEANTLQELKQIIHTLGHPFVYYSDL